MNSPISFIPLDFPAAEGSDSGTMPHRLPPLDRHLRPHAQQPADQRHRSLQHPLLLLHAGRERAVHATATNCSRSRRSSGSCGWSCRCGVNKIRLTGGEPLVRKDLHKLVGRIAAIPGIDDIGLTTNGILLAEQAQALYDAGLRRLNVSLDALSAEKFQEITRREGYEQVLAGIDAAQAVGFEPIKINAVSVRGLTEDEIVPFGHFARETGCEMRFIEYMPLDADGAWERDKVLFAHEIIETLSREIAPAGPVCRTRIRALRRRDFEFADGVRPHRLHRLGQPAVLHELQPLPPHRRRQAAELPVQPGRDRHPRAMLREGGPTMLRSRSRAGLDRARRRKATRSTPPGSSSRTRPMYSIGGLRGGGFGATRKHKNSPQLKLESALADAPDPFAGAGELFVADAASFRGRSEQLRLRVRDSSRGYRQPQHHLRANDRRGRGVDEHSHPPGRLRRSEAMRRPQ